MKKIEKIKQFLGSLTIENLHIPDYVYESDDISSYDELRELLEDRRAFDVEIIYYSNAIKYLQENDASLKDSLQIASEMCYEVKNLSSEILASLLASENCRNEFYDLQNEIESFFEELQTAIEE